MWMRRYPNNQIYGGASPIKGICCVGIRFPNRKFIYKMNVISYGKRLFLPWERKSLGDNETIASRRRRQFSQKQNGSVRNQRKVTGQAPGSRV